MRILLFGRTGQVGHELLVRLEALGEVDAPGRADVDLLASESAVERVHAARPDLIVNASGYTDVDGAEADEATAVALNGTAVGAIADAAAEVGASVVHYSTDYVFDGSARSPIGPGAPTRPLNAYGRSKLVGERLLAASGAHALLLRTAWVYSDRRRNFMRTIRRLAAERDELRVVDDQRGSPTPAAVIADATAAAIPSWLERRSTDVEAHHVVCRGATTWFGFARAIVEGAGLTTPVIPVSTAEFPTPARRPANSVLDPTSFEETFGYVMPGWREALLDAENGVRPLSAQRTSER